MANPIVISPARFNRVAGDTSPVYRYPKAGLLGRSQKVTIAAELLVYEVKPRHIRKCLGISGRQFKVVKKVAKLAKAYLHNIETNG